MLNPEHATQALVAMALQRGLHASLQESRQEWDDVTADDNTARLSRSWQRLFADQPVESAPLNQLTDAQLPAWVVHDDHVGVLRKLANDDQPAQIGWIGAQPQTELDNDNCSVLFPILSAGKRRVSYIKKKATGPATAVIRAAMKRHVPLFRNAAIATVCINLIAVLSSLFAMQVYDRVVPNFAYATLWFLAGGLAVAYVMDMLFKFVRLGLMEASKHQMDEVLSLYIFEKLMKLKLDRRPNRQGSLASQVQDYESIKAFFSSSTLFAIADLPFAFIFIWIIYLIGQEVAFVPLIFVGVSLLIGLLAYRPTAKRQQMHNDAMTQRHGMLYEAIAGGEAIKATGGEAKFADVWLSSTKDVADRTESLAKVTATAQYFTVFFQQLSYVSILAVGVMVIERGELTMGGLIACSILGGRTLGVISNISAVLLQWHHARYALNILNELLACPADDNAQRQSNTQSQPLELKLDDMAYVYAGSTMPQLAIPKLTFGAGSRTAIMGKNGSGKSTLLKLLAAIHTPSAGRVTIAGLDYEACRPSWLREVIGYLPQEPRLFSGTLVENLTLGLNFPNEADIWIALEKTGLADAVRANPLGLQLIINEGGSGLSGGQRQLVGLTRLLLQQPKIWILDEPAASLDNVAEKKLLEILQGLPEDNTLIYTTHKRSWLALSQRVIAVEAGQIVLDSPTAELKTVTAAEQAAAQEKATTGVETVPEPERMDTPIGELNGA
jgi:ATP-binding cassette subfamily C protein LapB